MDSHTESRHILCAQSLEVRLLSIPDSRMMGLRLYTNPANCTSPTGSTIATDTDTSHLRRKSTTLHKKHHRNWFLCCCAYTAYQLLPVEAAAIDTRA